MCCSVGDLVLILAVQGADCKDEAGVYARNLRTKETGWLEHHDDLHLRVVGCRGDIYRSCQDEQPSASVPERAPAPYSMGTAQLTDCVTKLETTAGRRVGTATRDAPAGFRWPCPYGDIVQCNHCNSTGRSCYSIEDSDYFSWCLQAKGWHCKKSKWRCPKCHSQEQNCQEQDLGEKCTRNNHGVLQHPHELGIIIPSSRLRWMPMLQK